jgi:hypothetical protein
LLQSREAPLSTPETHWLDTKIVDSSAPQDFARLLEAKPLLLSSHPQSRINLNPDNVKNGLAGLVLIIVKLVHDLLKKQAIRRVESGSLTEEQIERLGTTLMRQGEEIERLREEFGLDEEDLNIDLGPIGRLL